MLWLAVGAATATLLVAAIHKKNTAICKNVIISISGIENTNGPKLVDEKDILNTIQIIIGTNPIGKAIGSFNLSAIELELEKSKWIKNAELFFDNNDVLKVTLQEKKPIARVFVTGGSSFYIDTALSILPLSDKFSARLPVFTGFPSDKMVLTAKDSSLLSDIKNISLAIQKDSFCMAMIEQVDITPHQNFEMISKIGNQIIELGNANNIEEKFSKLQLFYKTVMAKSGWNKYSIINVQYNNQVVAKRIGVEDKSADSARTIQLLQIIAANAAKQAEDSAQNILPDNNNNTVDSSIIQQSIQRDDAAVPLNSTPNNIPLKPVKNTPSINPLPLAKPNVPKIITAKPTLNTKYVNKNIAIKKILKKPVSKSKPIIKTKTTTTQKPKAIMPPKNEYAPIP